MSYKLIEKREPKAGADKRGAYTYVGRIYACEATEIFVKTHTREYGGDRFGRVAYRITGSLCDAKGQALRDDAGAPLIHTRPHHFARATGEEIAAENLVAKLTADFEAAQLYVVAQVERAALLRVATAAL